MTKKLTLLLFLISVLYFRCDKKQTELEFEQSVVYEIFPALMDSLYYDFRLKLPRPPKPIFNEKGEIIGTDTTGNGKELADYKKRKTELKADSIKLVIAIRDSVYSLELKEREELLKHFSEHNLILNSNDFSTEYKIDLEKLIADDKLKFKYLSEFPKGGSNIWKNEYAFYLNATTSLSRIQFDSTKSFGIFNSGMGCGKLCGTGVRVFIRKVNGKWIIDEIIVNEIA
ncbi:MAG: hypothetical protein DA407_08750 [Bacteroidetes bacterium]|nr:MAG: hypothetical protein DA407_08750 [Bacteroidota bacterium]